MALIADAKKAWILLIAVVMVHLVLISDQVEGRRGRTTLLEDTVFRFLSPLQRTTASGINSVRKISSRYLGLRRAYTENERLTERVRTLELLLQDRQERAHEAERLRQLLELRNILPLETLTAEVIARDGVSWFRTMTVNKGAEHGVLLDAAVITPSGVVGRVVERGPVAARVQLILDRDSGVGVLIERSRVAGVASGQVVGGVGPTDLEMKYVPALADVVIGDIVVTSGMDRIFPKGLVVGRVRAASAGSALFKQILIAPSARFDRVEEVLIVQTVQPASEITETVR